MTQFPKHRLHKRIPARPSYNSGGKHQASKIQVKKNPKVFSWICLESGRAAGKNHSFPHKIRSTHRISQIGRFLVLETLCFNGIRDLAVRRTVV